MSNEDFVLRMLKSPGGMTANTLPSQIYVTYLYGADPTGTKDSSTAMLNAINDAKAAGGGIIVSPPGTFLLNPMPIYSNIFHVGAGPNVTTYKLNNGANGDLFSAFAGNINLAGTYGSGPGPDSTHSVTDFGFYNLTLDGNRANQSSTSYVLRFYGYGFKLENLIVQHGYSGGILHDYYGIFPDQNAGYNGNLEAQYSNVKVYWNNGIGVEIGGPSDSQLLNCIFAESGSHNFHNAPNSTGLQVTSCHFWYPGQGNNSVSWLCEGPAAATNVECEGSDTVQLVINSIYTTYVGGSIFGGGHGGAGIQIGQVGGVTPYNQSIYQSGGLSTYTNPNAYLINTFLHDIANSNGFIWFSNDGINGNISATIFDSGSNTKLGGIPYSNNIINITIHDNAAGQSIYQQNIGSAQGGAIYDGDLTLGAAAALTGGNTYYVPVTVTGTCTLVGYRVQFGAGGNGTWEGTLYNDNNGIPGPRVLNTDTGNPQPTSTGVNSQTLFASVHTLINPGKYWLAVYVSSALDTIYQTTLTNVNMGACYTEVGTPPSGSHGTLTRVTNKVKVLGLLLNGWT